MAVGTTSTTAKAMKQYWNDLFLENLYDWRVMDGLTKKTNVPKGQGTTVWWVGINKVSPAGSVASTEGADPTSRSTTAHRVSAVLKEYNNLVIDSKLLIDTAIDGTKEAIIKDLAKDAAKLLDDTLLAKALSGGTALYANGKLHRSDVVKACTATIKDIRKAVRLLELSSVPRWADGYYVGLIHPDVKFDLQSDSHWEDIVKYRDTVKYDIKGEVGRIWGVRFVLAPTIPILTNSGSANVDIYRTMIFGPDYLGESHLGKLDVVINEPAKTVELGRKCAYGYNFVMATEILDNQRAVRLESSASLGSNS